MNIDHGTLQALGWDISFAVESVQHAAQQAVATLHDAAREQTRPCVIFRPRIYPDGNQWCALYGENLQEGVAGFGDTPAQAMIQFDVEFLNSRISVAKK